MRLRLPTGFPRFVLLLAALVLLAVGGILGFRSEPAFARADAFVAALERGERHLPPEHMASLWRNEIAAHQYLMRRDRWYGRGLAVTGLLALVGVIVEARRRSGPAVAWRTGRRPGGGRPESRPPLHNP